MWFFEEVISQQMRLLHLERLYLPEISLFCLSVLGFNLGITSDLFLPSVFPKEL
jgi:hypothetical protein